MSLLDEPYWAPSFEGMMGLVRVTGSPEGGWVAAGPKPAYIAARELIRGPRQLPVPKRGCDLRRYAASSEGEIVSISHIA